MSTDNKQTRDSRRKFIKAAVTTAYVAPLIASMPAHATFKSHGSKPVKKVWPTKNKHKKIYRYKRYVYKKYKRYNHYARYNRYTRYSRRRW